LFWALPGPGSNGTQQSQRPLAASKQMNSYRYAIKRNGSVRKICFDPFATCDEHANKGEMQIESIAVYQLRN